MTATDFKINEYYWFVNPGNTLMFPLCPPEVIHIKCVFSKCIASARFSEYLVEFRRVDNGANMNISIHQHRWVFATREEAEKYKLDSLDNFCKDIKDKKRQLLVMHREYKRLKHIYG